MQPVRSPLRSTARIRVLHIMAFVFAASLGLSFPGFVAETDAAELDPTRSRESASGPTVKVTVDPRLETCVQLDPRTGAFAPCPPTTTTGTGGSGATSPDPAPAPAPLAPIDYFEPDQDIDDFDAAPESVLPNAYLLGQLSGMAYLPSDEAEQVALEMGFEESPKLLYGVETGVGHSKAYVLHDDEAVIVVFEGSTNGVLGTDWQQNNLDFQYAFMPAWGSVSQSICFWGRCHTQYRYVAMHQGFLNATSVIFDKVLEEIEPLLASGQRKLWITGHSLGGAIAQITAFRLEFEESIPVQGVHVFGAPAVGDVVWRGAFEDHVTPNVHRWGLEHDPMPVATIEPLFFHVGIMNNLYADGSILLDGDESDAMGGLSPCGPLYNSNYTHMNYWPRMHEEMVEADAEHGILLESSLPGPAEPSCLI